LITYRPGKARARAGHGRAPRALVASAAHQRSLLNLVVRE